MKSMKIARCSGGMHAKNIGIISTVTIHIGEFKNFRSIDLLTLTSNLIHTLPELSTVVFIDNSPARVIGSFHRLHENFSSF